MRDTSAYLVQACGDCTVRKLEDQVHDESATDQVLGFVRSRAGRHVDSRGHSIE